MMICETIRDELAVNLTSEALAVQEHLAQCPACMDYRRAHIALDTVLRSELRWETPAALTAQLLAIAATTPLVGSAPLVRPQPKSWYVSLVYALTIMAIVVSVMIGWQFVSLLIGPIGLDGALTRLLAAPAQGIQELARVLPESRLPIALFLEVRNRLLWVLLAAILWAALDTWNRPFNFGRPTQW